MMNGKDMTMVNRIDEHSTDEQIPTAAAVYRFVTGKEPLSPALQADKSTAERSWAEIAAIAAEGRAAEKLRVGDRKRVTVRGTVGTQSFDCELEAVLIGFRGGRPRFALGLDGELRDDSYGRQVNGRKVFSMNHWSGGMQHRLEGNYGGWAACDLRYDILGSTNKMPSGYGSAPTAARQGYDPENYDIVNAPRPDTLIAALPQELREVMRPMELQSDGGAVQTVDWLALLSAAEMGAGRYALPADVQEAVFEYFETELPPEPAEEGELTAEEPKHALWTRSTAQSGVPAAARWKAFCTVRPDSYKTAAHSLALTAAHSLALAVMFEV